MGQGQSPISHGDSSLWHLQIVIHLADEPPALHSVAAMSLISQKHLCVVSLCCRKKSVHYCYALNFFRSPSRDVVGGEEFTREGRSGGNKLISVYATVFFRVLENKNAACGEISSMTNCSSYNSLPNRLFLFNSANIY